MTKFLLLLVLISTVVSSSISQTASLYGTVHDVQTGENLIGANVQLMGTSAGAKTDLDGKFSIKGVPPGTYSVRFSYVGYGSKVVANTVLGAGESKKLDVSLQSETIAQEEVTVTADRVIGTEAAVLAERKRSASIGDGISKEQIRITPDATSGDALRRVTGISLVDNKFVFVRGVTDRYNGTTLNGVPVTSTDTDIQKKSFAFDMVPANLIENTIVAKSATPDLPGDFTGGLVQLKTLDLPDQRVFNVSISSSYNTLTQLKSVAKSAGSGTDWLGMDNGNRSFPSGSYDGYDLGKALPNNWAQRSGKAPLNAALGISIGDRLDFGESQMGYIAALSYRNSWQRAEVTQDYFQLGSLIQQSEGTKDNYSVLWGGILDLSYKFGGNHKISFKNNYNQSAREDLTALRVIDKEGNLNATNVTTWNQRSLYLGSVSGQHVFPELGGIEALWRLSYTGSTAEEPDRRVTNYKKVLTAPDTDPFQESIAHRTWANLKEYSRIGGIDLSYPLGAGKAKVGAFAQLRSMSYGLKFYIAELARYRPGGPIPEFDLLFLPVDQIFAPENFGPNKFSMTRLDDPHDLYDGRQEVFAGYAMIDLPFSFFGEDFRLVSGVRLENSDQRVNTISPESTNERFTAVVRNVDYLPSLNFTYFVNPRTNLRLAYSQSVNRPEFRELSSFYFYDYAILEGNYGNPRLHRALIRNYDVRLEMFPETGQVLAVSYFYKSISDAIEQKLVVSSNPERTWFNSPSGKNYGWEFEFRKSLSFLGEYFGNFLLTGNYTRILSSIDYFEFYTVVDQNGVPRAATRNSNREMQGQSPYMVNLSLLFREPSSGTTVNVLYNAFGRKLDAVGDVREEDIMEDARGVLDLTVTHTLFTGVDAKFSVRDIQGKARTFTTRGGSPYRSSSLGTTYGLQLSISL